MNVVYVVHGPETVERPKDLPGFPTRQTRRCTYIGGPFRNAALAQRWIDTKVELMGRKDVLLVTRTVEVDWFGNDEAKSDEDHGRQDP